MITDCWCKSYYLIKLPFIRLIKQIQQADASIQEQTKVNEDLKVQVKELSEYERLWKKAEEFGFKRNENNVKVVQQ